jgi:uncharacterized protein YndB with AHSA1/START domain
MADDRLSATTVIPAPAESIFAVLTDPAQHAAINGTGWVRGEVDGAPLTAAGQIFKMSMYHPNHPERPDGKYETANRIQVFDPPRTISWETGYDPGDGNLRFGGWFWRYDLTPADTSNTSVTLTYDWSACSDSIRELIGFPPFPPEHLDNSLAHLAELVRI